MIGYVRFVCENRLTAAPKKQATKIYFSTREYELSHGAKPRGRGSWAFAFDGEDRMEDLFWTAGALTFTEAKRVAMKEAKARGARSVEAQP